MSRRARLAYRIEIQSLPAKGKKYDQQGAKTGVELKSRISQTT